MGVLCFAAVQRPNSLITSPTLINIFFTSNNAIFNATTQAHFLTLFNQEKPPKNRYTRKQPTHFSMTP